jgi:hypothetical protein
MFSEARAVKETPKTDPRAAVFCRLSQVQRLMRYIAYIGT